MAKNEPIAALFDLDGVVLDTETQYSNLWERIGATYHPEIPRFDLVIKGQTLTQIFEHYFVGMDEQQKQIIDDVSLLEQNMSYNYIAGVKDFVYALKQKGIFTAIVTSSGAKKMKTVMKHHPEFVEMFDRILTAEMFAASKPDPACFLLGAEVFHAPIENCVVFEDSFHGLEAGRRARMKVVGLATTNSADSIKDKADFVIDDFTRFQVSDFFQMLEK